MMPRQIENSEQVRRRERQPGQNRPVENFFDIQQPENKNVRGPLRKTQYCDFFSGGRSSSGAECFKQDQRRSASAASGVVR